MVVLWNNIVATEQQLVFTKAHECRKLVEKIKIVRNEDGYEFVGTDEPSKEITYYMGVLVTTDGAEWEWYLDDYEPINILELIKDIIPDPFEK